MKNNFEIKKEFTITKQGMLDLFYHVSTMIGYSSFEGFDCSRADYEKARSIFNAYNKDEITTVEDVWKTILMLEGKMQYLLYDDEDDTVQAYDFDLDHLMSNFHLIDDYLLDDLINENDDAVTADAVLQYLLLGELVYC